MGIAGIGAFAGGAAKGIQAGVSLNNQMEEAKFRAEDRERLAEDRKREDAMRADNDAARVAAGKVMENFKLDFEKNKPQSILDGANVQQSTAFQPTMQQRLKAQEAFTDELFTRGRSDEAMQHWIKGEQQRAQIRQSLAPGTKAALAAGGDATAALKAFYDTVDDGYDLDEAKLVKGLGGNSYQLTRTNRATGEKVNSTLSAEQMEMQIDVAAAKPEEAAKFALQSKLEALKHSHQTKQIDQKADRGLEQIDARNAGSLDVANVRNAGSLDVANVRADASRDVAEKRVSGTITAAKLRAGAGKSDETTVHSSFVNAAGERVLIMRDRSRQILVNDDGSPMKDALHVSNVLRLGKEIGSSVQGITKTPEENIGTAKRALESVAKPTPTRPAGLPAGAKYVGTSMGKPVYETPDGKRLIDD